jgi:hypothetical protein
MKITKRQLKRIIREEVDTEAQAEHHWPRVSWDEVGTLVDKWSDMESKAFDTGDPSMTKDGKLSATEAKAWWGDQVESAAMDMEAEMTLRIRKVALQTMQEFTNALINGDYSA